MDNAKEKSFEYAIEVMKLILSLSTGVIALTVTFLSDIIGDRSVQARFLLILSWIFLLLAALFCIACIMAISGSLDSLAKAQTIQAKEDIHIYNSNIRKPGAFAVGAFFLGVLSVVIFATSNMYSTTIPNKPTQKTTPKTDTTQPSDTQKFQNDIQSIHERG